MADLRPGFIASVCSGVNRFSLTGPCRKLKKPLDGLLDVSH